jgi:hypothetical protein
LYPRFRAAIASVTFHSRTDQSDTLPATLGTATSQTRSSQGEDTQAAREFVRQARLLAALTPDANNENLINIIGAKMSGTAAHWFDIRREDFPHHRFEMEAFSQQFV